MIISSNPPEANWFWPPKTCFRNSNICVERLFGRHDLHLVVLLVVRFLILCESDLAIHIFSANDPGDFFHVRLAGHALVVVIRALAHLEGNKPRRTQESAQNDLFTFRESSLNVCPVARVAERLCKLRPSIPDFDDAHMHCLLNGASRPRNKIHQLPNHGIYARDCASTRGAANVCRSESPAAVPASQAKETQASQSRDFYFVSFALKGAEELTDAFGRRPEATQACNWPLLPA